jgi:hypothetical protein
MRYYAYSREEALARARAWHEDRLERIFDGNGEEFYRTLMFHAYCLEAFPREMNGRVFSVLEKAVPASGLGALEGLEAAFALRAAWSFRKAGYGDLGTEVSPRVRELCMRSVPSVLLPWDDGDTVRLAVAEGLEPRDEINTSRVLEALLHLLEAGGAERFEQYLRYYLPRLLMRFEATGRVYRLYDREVRVGRGGYGDIDNYVLLSATLLRHYRLNGSLRALNCVLKLNDMAVALLLDGGVKSGMTSLAAHSLWVEGEEVKRLYDNRGYRLPAHQ